MLITVKLDWACLVRSTFTDDEIIWSSLNLFDSKINDSNLSDVIDNAIQQLALPSMRETTLFIELNSKNKLQLLEKKLQGQGIVISAVRLLEITLITYMLDKSWVRD